MAELTLHTYRDPEIFNFNIVNADNRKIEEAVNGTIPWSLASNENLLINWYFADPINQRGQTEYATDGYIIDRWKKFSGTNTARITDEGLAFSGNGVNSHRMIQPIENAAFLNGKSITLSALVKNPNSEFQIGIQNQTTGVLKKFSIEPSTDFTVISFTTSIAVSPNDIVNFLMYPSKTSSVYEVVVSAAKLELGDHQTLAHQDANGNWVLNDPPPDKALELAKCQRYYISFNEGIYPSGYITGSALEYYANLSLPVPLRAYPSLVGTPAFTVRLPTGGYSSRFPIGTATADSYRLGGYAANCISLVGIINAAVDPNNIPISLKVMPFALDAELY